MADDKEHGGETHRIGATAEFPFDRLTVAWFVPGKTASRRINSWLSRLEAEADAHGDEKGRDAFDFDPITSLYLEVGTAGFRIRTPYSRTVVDELRQVPFASWDSDLRIWHVPYRSFDELRRHWPAIEAAAGRNEPAARKARREAAKGSREEIVAKARATERRRCRYPIPSIDPPPLNRPTSTLMGIVVFTLTHGEIADPAVHEAFYPGVEGADLVWFNWRRPTLQELVATWPMSSQPSQADRARGWWLPTLDELRPARREATKRERRTLVRPPLPPAGS
jgi:hypothetical protein